MSITLRLPLLISGLLALTIGGFSWAAYTEVRRSALAAALERLERITLQFSDQLSAGVPQRAAEVRRVASQPALAAYLRARAPGARRAALIPLAELTLRDSLNTAELWTATGERLLAVGRPLPPLDPQATSTLRESAASDVRTGPFRIVRDSLFFSVIAAVRDGGGTAGYVVKWHRVVSSPRAGQRLRELIGSDGALLLGNVEGDVWTDLAAPIAGPPVDATQVQGVMEYERPGGGMYLARSAAIAGAPWLVVIELPRDRVLAPAQRFLGRIGAIALLLVAAGAVGAWAVSRRITSPLRRLAEAAQTIAADRPTPRLDVRRPDELGLLVHSFNTMADRVEKSRQLEDQLRQAQKMEAVGRLAGGVAHDFNNILTAIFGYADLLLEELPDNDVARRDVEEIRRAAARAATLTRQLLAFSRQQVLQPTVLNLNDVVQNVESMLGRLIGEDVELRTALAPDLGNVRADPSELEQVILNLAVNARDAMPTGGKLTIETANAELGEQYAQAHQPVVPGRYVMLAMSDTGIGMDPETRGRIFEPFFTTKEKGKGTGLGLSMVYGIVKQSGGYIWAYSEPGRGATFKIYLPRVDAVVEAAARPREIAGTPRGSETILVAEDDELVRPLARGLLQKLGYTVLEAANAPEALAHARGHAGTIHLLISDVVMPGASGRELARRLAEVRPDARVLYISGYTDDAIVRHGMLEPGLNYLQKPFTPTALARKVREVLDASSG